MKGDKFDIKKEVGNENAKWHYSNLSSDNYCITHFQHCIQFIKPYNFLSEIQNGSILMGFFFGNTIINKCRANTQ